VCARAQVTAGYRPEIPADVPESLAALIARCWAANPADRPSMQVCACVAWFPVGCAKEAVQRRQS
jgi:hypothetical protein